MHSQHPQVQPAAAAAATPGVEITEPAEWEPLPPLPQGMARKYVYVYDSGPEPGQLGEPPPPPPGQKVAKLYVYVYDSGPEREPQDNSTVGDLPGRCTTPLVPHAALGSGPTYTLGSGPRLRSNLHPRLGS